MLATSGHEPQRELRRAEDSERGFLEEEEERGRGLQVTGPEGLRPGARVHEVESDGGLVHPEGNTSAYRGGARGCRGRREERGPERASPGRRVARRE